MNKTYVVCQTAVYLHDVWGPFSLEQAKEFADTQASHPDEDGHHAYAVCLLDQVTGLGVGVYVAKRKNHRTWNYKSGDASNRARLL